MAQVSASFCPRCGAPLQAGQHFCASCGLVLGEQSRPPAPLPMQPLVQPAQQGQVSWHAGPPPAPQPPRRRPRRRMVALLVLLLLVVVLLGVGVYVVANLMGLSIPGPGPAAQSQVTTTQLNTTLTYAGADLTILTAQQAQSFAGDPNMGGLLRLNIQERNTTSSRVNLAYANIARLNLPGNSSVAPAYVKARGSIAPGATQSSSIDFAVPGDVQVKQLTLILGSAAEAQLQVPLTGHANVSAYAPKSVNLHGEMVYLGLNYTLVSATAQWSIAGQQASKGMNYLVVTLKVDNSLSQQAIPGSVYDYMRLATGRSSAAPVDSTLPTAFGAGKSGASGSVTFLVPQHSSVFTITLLPQGGSVQASTQFQFA